MRILKPIIHHMSFELKLRLGRLSTLIYFGLYASIALLMVLASGGGFKGVTVSFGLANKVFLNSPFALNLFITLVSYLGLLIVAPIFGQAIFKDYDARMDQILFSTPTSRFSYLVGRYLGALVITLFIFSGIGLGIWVGTGLGIVSENLLTTNQWRAYVLPYLTGVIPNTFVWGSVFFMIAAGTKKIAPVYIASVVLFMGWMISGQLIADIDNKLVAALIDPFGMSAVGYLTEYWTVNDQNTRFVLLEGYYLYNRLLWGLLGTAGLILTGFFFSYQRRGKSKINTVSDSIHPRGIGDAIAMPLFCAKSVGAMLTSAIRFEFKQAFKNIHFLTIFLCGVLYMLVVSTQLGKMFGTQTFPVTYKVVELLGGTFGLFMLIIITFYSGEMVWRERNNRMDQIIDALPTPTYVAMGAKIITLYAMVIVLLGSTFVCGIIIQSIKGYFHFEFPLYFKHLLGVKAISWVILVNLAVAVQVLVNHKYFGHGVMVLYYVASTWLPSLGFEHNLYLVNGAPLGRYSDMNGYGHFLPGYFAFKLYWLTFSLLSLVLAYLFWQRGTSDNWQNRLLVFRHRFSKPIAISMVGLMMLWVGQGGFIYYNTNILNPYRTAKDDEQDQYNYEHLFQKTYQLDPFPEVYKVGAKVDLFPSQRKMNAQVVYQMENKSDRPMDHLFLTIPRDIRFELSFDQPSQLKEANKDLGVFIYKFDPPLVPGGNLQMTYRVWVHHQGFTNQAEGTQLVANGTFFNNWAYFPLLGYQSRNELESDKTRAKYGLKPKARMPNIDDVGQQNRNYLSNNASWVDFEAVVSTDSGQMALVPGYLIKQWESEGRSYFHYRMDQPILHFFAFMSGKYRVKKEIHQGISLEVYYHPTHSYNVTRMISASKLALDYLGEQFGPYQHKQFRIIEFPRYANFAQAFPNTIPFAESVGFIAQIDDADEKDIDYPLYVTAHELAHQWWAHQVIGANVQGATLLSESLAQYSALMVMEKKFGRKKMKRFLAYELNQYLKGRGKENKRELPLALNENQSYIHYSKGSLVLYALKDYVGEENLNRAIRQFRDAYANKGAPYPTSKQLVHILKTSLDPAFTSLIEDLFNRIVLFENRAMQATYVVLPDKSYRVTLAFFAKKVVADGRGQEVEQPFSQLIEIGIRGQDDQFIYLKKHNVVAGKGTIEVDVQQLPKKAGIDPLNILIDKQPEDNEVQVEQLEPVQ